MREGFNALSGLFSFLRTRRWKYEKSSKMFQRPKRALLISTHLNLQLLSKKIGMFQRPKRALLISTMRKVLVFICLSIVSTP